MEDYRYFAIMDKNEMVINVCTFPRDTDDDPLSLLEQYSNLYHIKEYSNDKSITNNEAAIGAIYVTELNCFKYFYVGDDWIFNEETSKWEEPPEEPSTTP